MSAYYQTATEQSIRHIANIREMMQKIETEITGLETQHGFDYDDQAMLANLSVTVESAFQNLIEAQQV